MKTHRFDICPRCQSNTEKAINVRGGESEFWYKCTKCETYINTYIPQQHQRTFHTDSHRYKGNFGGYGTGKTLTSRQEVYKHIFLSPGSNVLIGANTASQYDQTIRNDILKDIPEDFVINRSKQKNYLDFMNGARLMFRPLRDFDKLRSFNLGMFVIVEASETKAGAFHQLKTRLRNTKAGKIKKDENGNIVYRDDKDVPVPVLEADWRKGIIESNPDSGYIRSDILLNSDKIFKHEVLDDYSVLEDSKDPSISSHVASTQSNAYLPDGFIDEITKNKPDWWVARYVLSSFSYSEGLVYPNAPKCVIDQAPIPNGFKHILACDYGISDDFVYLLGAVDEDEGVVYIYNELVMNDRNIENLAEAFKEFTAHIPPGMWVTQPILDPKSGAKRDYNKKTLYSHFEDYGIYFKPGHVQLDARITRTNTYLESGKLKIMDNCSYLIKQLENYKFPSKSLDSRSRSRDKPIDKDNHAINPLEWICMELPADPRDLIRGHYGPSKSLVNKKDRDEYYQNPLATPLTEDELNNNNKNFDFRKGVL
jgi:phage terminase large subunit